MGYKLLRSRWSLAVMTGMKKPNDHAEPIKSNAKKQNTFILRPLDQSAIETTLYMIKDIRTLKNTASSRARQSPIGYHFKDKLQTRSSYSVEIVYVVRIE